MSGDPIAELRPMTPASLTSERRWVAWRQEPRKPGEAPTKVPYRCDGRARASSIDPATWGTREEAEAGAKRLRMGGKIAGIGTVFGRPSKNAPTVLCGIDLDQAADEFGAVKPWAEYAMAELPTYWEISPSGIGYHGLFRLAHAELKAAQALLKSRGHVFKEKDGPPQHKPGVEIYVEDRFFTFTENHVPDTPTIISLITVEDLQRLIDGLPKFFGGAPRTRRGKNRDQTRSGASWRHAIQCIARNLGRDDFMRMVDDDPDLGDYENAAKDWDKCQEAYGWLRELQRGSKDGKGAPLNNTHNVLLMLRNARDLHGLFAFDGMQRQAMLMKPVPDSETEWTKPRPIRDEDIIDLQDWIQAHGLRGVGRQIIDDAVTLVATEHRFHPVCDWLEKLSWDGVKRVDQFLPAYFGTPDDEYTRAIGRMFLISMVARIFKPGCQVDYVLVLEGTQGARKSTGCRILAGDDFFSDSLPDISSKDSSQHLRDKWLVEIGEMHTLTKAEINDMKRYITRRDEKYRPAYGRREVTEPRHNVFVGTTNESQYLRDDTGNRRFWPVTCDSYINTPALITDRDQIFAEAVKLYKDGEHWWPEPEFEERVMKPQQDARHQGDAWEESIMEYVTFEMEQPVVTISEIAAHVFQIDESAVTKPIEHRIAGILKRNGYKPGRIDGKRGWRATLISG